jgi:hypothetical protein
MRLKPFLLDARAYFSVSNTTTGEILSEIAIRNRDVVRLAWISAVRRRNHFPPSVSEDQKGQPCDAS